MVIPDWLLGNDRRLAADSERRIGIGHYALVASSRDVGWQGLVWWMGDCSILHQFPDQFPGFS